MKKVKTTAKFTVCVLLSIALILSMTGCCLVHEWMPATCQKPRTCLRCGKTVDEVNKGEAGHRQGEWEQEDDSYVGGKELLKCLDCGKILDERKTKRDKSKVISLFSEVGLSLSCSDFQKQLVSCLPDDIVICTENKRDDDMWLDDSSTFSVINIDPDESDRYILVRYDGNETSDEDAQMSYKRHLEVYLEDTQDFLDIAPCFLQAIDPDYTESSGFDKKCVDINNNLTGLKQKNGRIVFHLFSCFLVCSYVKPNNGSAGHYKLCFISMRNYLESVKEGDTIIFGSFEQDNNIDDGREDIEWLVLKKDGKKMLLLSKYVLDFRHQNTSYGTCDWENCRLRGWLNEDFYDDAFSDNEKGFITCSVVRKDSNEAYNDGYGRSTADFVFLLSFSEAKTYLTSKTIKATGTASAAAGSEWNQSADDTCYWWLRAPVGYSTDPYGDLAIGGLYVDKDGEYCFDEEDGVRPAIWIVCDGKINDGTQYYYVNTEESDLRLRKGKGTDTDILELIPKGTLITVTEYGSDWSKVTYKKKTGYVATEYITRAN